MSDKLSFKEEKLFNFLISKIAFLQTELKLQNLLTQSAFLLLSDNNKEKLELLRKGVEQERQLFFEKESQSLVAELQALSDDFENLLEDFLNQ